jgi:hypothetical protein
MATIQLFFDFADSPDLPKKEKPVLNTIISSPALTVSSLRNQTERVSINPDYVFQSYGAWVNFGKRLTTSERLRINREAIVLLTKSREQLTSANLNILRSYSGWGGLAAADERGVLYDYYTSPPVAFLVY